MRLTATSSGTVTCKIKIQMFVTCNLTRQAVYCRRTERNMIKNVYWSACTLPIILVKF